ncbi:dehydrogenase/reductase SDR family member 12-like [Achlya hypogyna]|uniref:Dehydrogenase/reductase SDR family member 12-like n=1 Tax=Achlya hypogyna TaxID=1202772 RepID=A0A1V9YMY3_ACHHY|nr:dehydrogenase/reductase SDR family member 12-like [Achlya hypogyna]
MSISTVASLQWYFTGLCHYGARGYRKASATWAETPVDVSARHYVVTGANSGLGFAVATKLAALGAHVHMVCRDAGRAEAARQSILETTHAEATKIVVHLGDLGKQKDVHKVAASVAAAAPALDGLLNNAGILAQQAKFTEDDVEASMAVAINGTYLLTALLLPQLRNHTTTVGRVVNMSSGGQYLGSLDLQDVRGKTRDGDKFNGTVAYMLAKKSQVALTQEWAKRFPLETTKVAFHAMNPGWATTPGTTESIASFTRIHGFMMRTPEEGADTAVWLCTAPEPAKSSGLFWLDRQVVPTEMSWARTAHTEEDRATLWAKVADICGLDASSP